MKTVYDYESLAAMPLAEHLQPVQMESWRGSDIVGWYGNIERQLQDRLDKEESARNHENADQLRAFLNTWRENPITGSISIDTLAPLKAAAEQLAADRWGMRNYFSSLRDQIRRLEASEEELPRGVDLNQLEPTAGGGGILGRGAPPMSPDFGPEKEPPPNAAEAGLPTEEVNPDEEKLMNAATATEPELKKAKRTL